MKAGRDHWWHELMATVDADCPAEPLDSEHPLFILYTSGSTGKPKGILHTTGGYLLQAHLTTQVGLRPQGRRHLLVHGRHRLGDRPQLRRLRPALERRDDADVRRRAELPGAGPLLGDHRAAPASPSSTPRRRRSARSSSGASSGRASTTCRACACSAPSASRSTPRRGCGTTRSSAASAARSSTRGGRPRRAAIMITPLPGATPTKPGSAHAAAARRRRRTSSTQTGKPVGANAGRLARHPQPWPAMLRTHLRRRRALPASSTGREIPGIYFTGDGARRDEDGYFWIMGRVDDVLNVTGHRLGTMEIESALVSHPAVAEAAVVGRPDELKGQAIVAFVTLEGGQQAGDELKKELRAARRARRSARSRGPTRSASPTRCRRRAAARSCAACCATSPPAARSPATRPRSKTSPCSNDSARRRKNERRTMNAER